MAYRVAFKTWIAVLMQWRAYWSERLGATFKVGEVTDLAAFDVKSEAFQALLQEIEDTKNHLQDLLTRRNVDAGELYKLLGDLKAQVGIIKGKKSPEFIAAPRLTKPPTKEDDEAATTLGPPPGTGT